MKINMELWSKVNKELALRGMEEAPFGEIRDAMESTERAIVELVAEEISLFRRRHARAERVRAEREVRRNPSKMVYHIGNI